MLFEQTEECAYRVTGIAIAVFEKNERPLQRHEPHGAQSFQAQSGSHHEA